MLDKKIKVKEIKDLGASNYLITLISPEQARLAQPGQFVMLKCSGDVDEPPLLRRPFSIFDVHPHPDTGRPGGLDLLVKDVGLGTRKLAGVKRGNWLHVLGPQGRPFQVSAEMRNRITTAVLVAGGVGIAAMYLLARSLLALQVAPILIYGGRGAPDLVLREYFERLGMTTVYTTEDGSCGERGIVTQPLEQFFKRSSRMALRAYACGPWGMMRAVHELCVRYNVHCEVSLEARMGCSLGACMGCVVHGWDDKGEDQYLRVCTEGPVMDSRKVDWEIYPF
jgi:dihydroorotate dehydrogenase electron transfer subunit